MFKIENDEQKKVFAKNLNRYISLNQKTQKEVAEAIGENPPTLNMWCSGKSFPSLGKIQKLADYFRIGKSDLTDEKNGSGADAEFMDNVLKIALADKRFAKIVVEYSKLPADEKELICDFFEKFIL